MRPNISSDKPVYKKEDDRFQRYDFSKRIADKIITSNNEDSIVIGIYGAWGEGKTSVINFIEGELKKNETIIPIRFNPWRFSEEGTLLVSFFNTLASEIKKSIPDEVQKEKNNFFLKRISLFKKSWSNKREPLKTNKETIGDLIEKYGKIVSFGAGEAVESFGKVLSSVDIETLKRRFEKLLVDSKKKLVVFIDDIDRLDKQEIHSIFRIVKLTADFSNTFYILSFDQDIVASSIGERFGSGDKQAGLSFLEKIIQVPLNIPVAQPEALKEYCFELVEKSINESKIELSKVEVQRFASEFIENIQIRLKTPRLAIRYRNSLSFSFPLLKGEVNNVDLMLIEALKIFYPKHYEFVKENSFYFLSSYDSSSYSVGHGDVETKKKDLSEHLTQLGHDLSKRERESVKSLLSELFPRLNEAFKNTFYNGEMNWYKDKRIVSPNYFKRYFSFTVIKGEVSDILFDRFINSIESSSSDEIIHNMKQLIGSSSIDNFLHKIRSQEKDIDWKISKKLALCIALSGEVFKENFSVFTLGFQSPKSQAAIFLFQLLKNHDNKSEDFDFAKELLNKAYPYDFAYEIIYWLRAGKTDDDKIFTEKQNQELGKELIDRALLESKDEPIFITFSNNLYYILGDWKEIDINGFNTYFKNTLDSEPKRVLDLLRALTSITRSNVHPEPYLSDFTKEQFKYFTSLFDKDYIHKHIIDTYTKEIDEEEVKFTGREYTQTDINILRQFNYWYENENLIVE